MIFVHIGLHKTATTSMQMSVFPELDGINYLGRIEGVSQKSIKLYSQICDYCFREEINVERKSEIILQLRSIEGKGENILLSEEWFTSDYSRQYKFSGASWQEKLRRLSELLVDFEYRILVSIRNPIDCFYSQYTEFHIIGIDNIFPTFEDYVKKSNESLVYDYLEFDKYLNRLFRSVFYVDFDSFKSERYKKILSNFFNNIEIPDIERHNDRKKTSEGTHLVVSNNLTFINKFFAKSLSLFPENKVSGLRKKLISLKLMKEPSNIKVVPKISSKDESIFISKFSESLDYYFKLVNKLKS